MTDKILEALGIGLAYIGASLDEVILDEDVIETMLGDIEKIKAAIKLYKSNKPIAHAWFHRGMVNFDAEPELVLLDCAGKPIPLYVIPLAKKVTK